MFQSSSLKLLHIFFFFIIFFSLIFLLAVINFEQSYDTSLRSSTPPGFGKHKHRKIDVNNLSNYSFEYNSLNNPRVLIIKKLLESVRNNTQSKNSVRDPKKFRSKMEIHDIIHRNLNISISQIHENFITKSSLKSLSFENKTNQVKTSSKPNKPSPFYTLTPKRQRSCESSLENTNSSTRSYKAQPHFFIVIIIPKPSPEMRICLLNLQRLSKRIGISENQLIIHYIPENITIFEKFQITLNILRNISTNYNTNLRRQPHKPIILVSYTCRLLLGYHPDDIIQKFQIYRKNILFSMNLKFYEDFQDQRQDATSTTRNMYENNSYLPDNKNSNNNNNNNNNNNGNEYSFFKLKEKYFNDLKLSPDVISKYICGDLIFGYLPSLKKLLEYAITEENNLKTTFINKHLDFKLQIDYLNNLFGLLPSTPLKFSQYWALNDYPTVQNHSTITPIIFHRLHSNSQSIPAIIQFSSANSVMITVVNSKTIPRNFLEESYSYPLSYRPIISEPKTIEFIKYLYNWISWQMFYYGSYERPVEYVNPFMKRKDYRLVVSLTTVPARIQLVEQTIQSILSQVIIPDAIYLNIPKESQRFKSESYIIPSTLRSLPIIINRCIDYGPATKLIPTLEVENDPNTLLVTIDDDMIFKPTLLLRLFERHLVYPLVSYANAGQMIDINDEFGPVVVRSAAEWKDFDYPIDILEAFLGVIYRRDFFDLETIRKIPSTCFSTDDIWFSSNLAIRGIPRIKVIQQPGEFATFSKNDNVKPLREGNVFGERKNDMCALRLLTTFQMMWLNKDDLRTNNFSLLLSDYCSFESMTLF